MIGEALSLGKLALDVGGGLFGLGRDREAEKLAQQSDAILLASDIQENAIRRQQMNLDAVRRKRDILRNAQVAGASSTAKSYGQGAGFSSFAAGAQSSISGAAGTQTTGIELNRQFGEAMFAIEDQRISAHQMGNEAKRRQQSAENRQQGFNKIVGAISGNWDDIMKFGETAGSWGTNAFSGISMF